MNIQWNQLFKIFVIAFLSFSVFFLFTPFLIPIAMGGILSVVVYPYYQKLLAKKINMHLAAILTILTVYLLFITPATLITIRGAKMTSQFMSTHLAGYISAFGTETTTEKELVKDLEKDLTVDEQFNLETTPEPVVSESQIETYLQKLTDFIGFEIPNLKENIKKAAMSVATVLMKALSDFFKFIPSLILTSLIALITIYFGLTESHRIQQLVLKYSTLSQQNAEKFMHKIFISCRSVIFANLITGGVQSMIIATAASISRSGDFFVVGFLTFVCSFIPVVGAAPVGLVTAVIQFIEGNIGAGIAMTVVSLITGIIDNVIRPYILSESGDTHALFSLLAVMGGVIIFGLPGLFIGPLILAIAMSSIPIFYEDYVNNIKK